MQKSSRFPIGKTAPGGFGCNAKIFDCALPIRSVFEVPRQFGRCLAQTIREESFQLLPDPLMQLSSAPDASRR